MATSVLTASVLALFLVSMSPLPQLAAATTTSASAPLNPVQLSIQTKSITPVSSYDLVAFNSTGSAVASYTGQYPRMTFELPSGTYLFAATATGPSSSQSPVCCVCAGSGVSNPPAKSASSNGSVSAVSGVIAYPCFYNNPAEEYGYSLTQVNGAASLTISTAPPSGIQTSDVSVSVSYKNGTAVSGAYVSANVVGADWYWGNDANVTMSAQTAADGVAKLVVPSVPLVVTASDSIRVSLPKSQTTTQINVGGQLVNVTVYYSPSYVYETATALLIPPQTSLSMVVTAQQGNQIIPYGVANGGGVASGVAAGVPASQGSAGASSTVSSSTVSAQTTSIPAFSPAVLTEASSSHSSSSTTGISLWTVGAVVVALAIVAIVGIAVAMRKR